MKRGLSALERAAIQLGVSVGLTDDDIADLLRLGRRQIWGYRMRHKLPNGAGWPISAQKLKELLDSGLTDAEIGEQHGITRRIVEQHRIERLGLYRSQSPKPGMRRIVVDRDTRHGRRPRFDLPPLEQAVAVLGSRVKKTGDAWWLDGRPATVQDLLSAAKAVRLS